MELVLEKESDRYYVNLSELIIREGVNMYTIPVDGWYQSSLEIKPKYYKKGDKVDVDNVKYFVRVK